jgi:tetratricopeptide (TPR) repeat protein
VQAAGGLLRPGGRDGRRASLATGIVSARRIGVAALVAAALSFVLLFVATVVGRTSSEGKSAPGSTSSLDAPLASNADAAQTIVFLQARLKQFPADHDAWAALGATYVAQARLTADPSYYPKADGAFAESMKIEPVGNALALTGLATLAAARHDFVGAEKLARQSKAINPYGAVNQGVLSDALIEQGRYDEAGIELQKMLDLKPGVPSLTRASYYFELRGEPVAAAAVLNRAASIAYSPSDAAYAQYYLGELAFNSGDLKTAAKRYAAGIARDPAYLPLVEGRAKVEAAQGKTAAAIRDYAIVVARLPQPSYVIEYGDLLKSLGRAKAASAQYAVVGAEEKLFIAAGVNVDLELALFDADHGRPVPALAAAKAEWDKRKSIQVEDAYGWALHVNGRDKDALVHANAAARTGMSNALFAYHRGMIEKSLGMNAAAVTSLERALRINPHFSTLLAPEAHAALTQLERAK